MSGLAVLTLFSLLAIVYGQWSSTTPWSGARQCQWGMGYPPSCPRPGDPPSYTQCCRNRREPSCCSEKSRTVCGVLNTGHTRARTGTFYYDPGPTWETLWCPSHGNSDSNVHCCFSKTILFPFYRMSCCSAAVKWGIIGGVVGGVVLIGLVCFVGLRCRAHRAQQASSSRSAVITSSLSASPSVYTTPSNPPVSSGEDTYQTPKEAAGPPDYNTATGGYPQGGEMGPYPPPGGAMAPYPPPGGAPYPPPSGAPYPPSGGAPYPPAGGAAGGAFPTPGPGYGTMGTGGDSNPPPYPGPPVSGPVYHQPQQGAGPAPYKPIQ